MPHLYALRLTLQDHAPNRAAAPVPPAKQTNRGGAAAAKGCGGSGEGSGRRAPMNALAFLRAAGKAAFPRSVTDLALVGAVLHRDSVAELCARLGDERCGWTSLDLAHAHVGPTGALALAQVRTTRP